MKILNTLMGFALATTIVAAPSCKKIDEFGDINNDPNRATEPVPSALLTNVLSNLGNNIVWDQGGVNTVAGLYAQYFSETQYTEASRYARPTFNFDGYYTGPLQDLQAIIEFNSNPETMAKATQYGSNKNQIAIARILKAQYFKFLTDAYGDIPYFGALKGQGVVTYDKQENIYPDLLKEFREAADQIELNSALTLRGDILFGGNMAKWKKYANSLRALTALNMRLVNPTLAKSEFQAAINAGVIEQNSDNAVLEYPGGNYPNPFYNYYFVTQRKDYAVSKTMTDRLANDPRSAVFGTSTNGFPYGLTRDQAVAFANANSNYAVILNNSFKQTSSPLVIIGAGNMWLARAEAAQTMTTTDDKTVAYTTGIQRNMARWGITDATAISNYIASRPPTDLQAIATEEWKSWFPNGMEGWNVWRRTGFPALTPAPGQAAIPTRFPYGQNEYNLNTANVQAAAARYTVAGVPDSQFAKVWWDQ